MIWLSVLAGWAKDKDKEMLGIKQGGFYALKNPTIILWLLILQH